ncbi:hypothetical protein KEK_08682 [Mycolicibacterium thermoresistibile ATCC 19527]|jgi:hypothetical protein|uniref:Uncharacterized protein n=2 Tax=Mycolicibacterium thermoresistibile TaxID=1797 RepID=G7CFG5_MYCT3|nr:hypothetical protein KEK_08682 [Mycolicibacterium thermoresistibile ATCC 19527]
MRMPKGKGIYDEENAPKDEPKGGRPGPTDQGREGGMATREQAPDVVESGEEPTA